MKLYLVKYKHNRKLVILEGYSLKKKAREVIKLQTRYGMECLPDPVELEINSWRQLEALVSNHQITIYLNRGVRITDKY